MLFLLLVTLNEPWELVLVNGVHLAIDAPVSAENGFYRFRDPQGQAYVVRAQLVRETRPKKVPFSPPTCLPIPKPQFPIPQKRPEKPITVTDTILKRYGESHHWVAPQRLEPDPLPPSEGQLQAQKDHQEQLNRDVAHKTQPIIERIAKAEARLHEIRIEKAKQFDEQQRRKFHVEMIKLQKQIERDQKSLVRLQESARKKGAKIRD